MYFIYCVTPALPCHVSFKEPDLLLKSLQNSSQDPSLLLNNGEAEVTGTTVMQQFRANPVLDPRAPASWPGPGLRGHISDQ